MPVVAIIGAQWGDEGKGKVVDLLAAKAGVVVRSQGGANAGHTIIRQQKVILHLLPSGILTPKIKCLIGPGVVLDPDAFIEEVKAVEALGVDLKGRLTLDLRTHLVFPTHKLLDACQERARGKEMIGTTSRGIGPAYADKAARHGVRVGDLLDSRQRKKACGKLFDNHAALLKGVFHEEAPDRAAFMEKTEFWAETLKPFTGDTVALLHDALDRNQTIILEGAQGTLLDLDLGTYPFVTSSHPTVAGPIVAMGIPPQRIDSVIGVLKAYCTRVGSGPFPTEMDEKTAKIVRSSGGEFGSTTGRPRRCGWLDLVAAKQVARWNGCTGWAITKLDVLDNLEPIKVCTGYRLGRRNVQNLPAGADQWEAVKPLYEELPSWKKSAGARRWEDIPKAAQNYLAKIESFTGVPIELISLGASQEATILPRGEII
ncbi:MAG: adenylosuccinate synthase [bacterium]|nr:adenylosuccinate synthase [bacterium]